MGVKSGEGLDQIVRRKEAERIEGNGQFWWGIGSSLGSISSRRCARARWQAAWRFQSIAKPSGHRANV
jgi:hypothetical protein